MNERESRTGRETARARARERERERERETQTRRNAHTHMHTSTNAMSLWTTQIASNDTRTHALTRQPQQLCSCWLLCSSCLSSWAINSTRCKWQTAKLRPTSKKNESRSPPSVRVCARQRPHAHACVCCQSAAHPVWVWVMTSRCDCCCRRRRVAAASLLAKTSRRSGWTGVRRAEGGVRGGPCLASA